MIDICIQIKSFSIWIYELHTSGRLSLIDIGRDEFLEVFAGTQYLSAIFSLLSLFNLSSRSRALKWYSMDCATNTSIMQRMMSIHDLRLIRLNFTWWYLNQSFVFLLVLYQAMISVKWSKLSAPPSLSHISNLRSATRTNFHFWYALPIIHRQVGSPYYMQKSHYEI